MSTSGAGGRPATGGVPAQSVRSGTSTSGAGGVLLLLAARSLIRRLAWALAPWTDAPPAIQAAASSDQTPVDEERRHLEDMVRFGTDILEKKYQLYMWCETKTYNLLTANGALLAAIFLLLNSMGDFHERPHVWLIGLLAGALVLASVVFSLINIIPRMDSGATSRKNLRSVIGTNNYANYHDYHDALTALDLRAMVHSNSEQIFGMNRNVWKAQRAIRRAAWFTAAGVVALALFAVLASTTKPTSDTGRAPATSNQSSTNVPTTKPATTPTSDTASSTSASQEAPESTPITSPEQGSP